MDVNPLLVTPRGVVALDARLRIDLSHSTEAKPFSHLAIRPYPQRYVRRETLASGDPVILRPIKPEDEPMWHDLVASCSTETIWFRFRYLFKQTTHEMATRFCFISDWRQL